MSEFFRAPYRHDDISYHFAVNDSGHVDVTAEDAQGARTNFSMNKNEESGWHITSAAGLPEWVYEVLPYLSGHLSGEL